MFVFQFHYRFKKRGLVRDFRTVLVGRSSAPYWVLALYSLPKKASATILLVELSTKVQASIR